MPPTRPAPPLPAEPGPWRPARGTRHVAPGTWRRRNPAQHGAPSPALGSVAAACISDRELLGTLFQPDRHNLGRSRTQPFDLNALGNRHAPGLPTHADARPRDQAQLAGQRRLLTQAAPDQSPPQGLLSALRAPDGPPVESGNTGGRGSWPPDHRLSREPAKARRSPPPQSARVRRGGSKSLDLGCFGEGDGGGGAQTHTRPTRRRGPLPRGAAHGNAGLPKHRTPRGAPHGLALCAGAPRPTGEGAGAREGAGGDAASSWQRGRGLKPGRSAGGRAPETRGAAERHADFR